MKWLRSAVLLTVLAPLVGCSLYFDDQGSGDDTHCTSTLPLGVAAQQLRNPETGACQSFPYNEDPCGVAETNSRVATPNWPACSGACEGLDQVTCSTTSGCHAYFNDGEYDDAANPASGSFLACGEVGTPTPVAQTDCTTLDANACANADWCESIVQPAAVGEVNANVFAYCAPISPSTTASCTTDSDCPVGDSCVAVPTPTICDLNGCTPQQYQCQATTTPPTCYTDADCASGSQCEFTNFDCNGPGSQTGETECPGQCVVVTPPPSQCYQDSDCPTGDTCQLSPRVPQLPCNSIECSVVGTCVLGTPPPPPAIDCYTQVECDISAPTCPTGELAEIVNGCYNGQCIAADQCADAPPSCVSLPDEASCQARTDCTAIFGGQGCTCDPASEVCNCPVITYQSCQAATQPTCESLTTEAACTARTDCQASYDSCNSCSEGPDGTVTCCQPEFAGCFTPDQV